MTEGEVGETPRPHRPLRPEEHGVPEGLQGLVSRALRGGTALSAALVVFGLVLLAVRGGPTLATPPAPFHLATLASELVNLQPFGFLLLGLVVLVLTPVSRVAISVALFAASGDRPFMWLTITVLTILLVSVIVGAYA